MANTIQDKLTYLSGTKDAIKQAIIGKGVEVTDTDTFRSYADKITSIQAGGGGTTNIPDGTKFGGSTFATVPVELFPYLEQQTNMYNMFSSCESLQTVPLFDTSKCITTRAMFNNCSSLTTVPLFDTSNVDDMSYMFNYCYSLTTVPLFDTSSVTNMDSMFSSCSSLTTVPQFDTSKTTNMESMFYECSSLTSIPQLDTTNVSNMSFTFDACVSLTNLGGFIGLKEDLDLSVSPLTVDSVMNIINNAADMTSSPKTLTLHKDVFNKLTEEQIATASEKGWNIAAS